MATNGLIQIIIFGFKQTRCLQALAPAKNESPLCHQPLQKPKMRNIGFIVRLGRYFHSSI